MTPCGQFSAEDLEEVTKGKMVRSKSKCITGAPTIYKIDFTWSAKRKLLNLN